MSGKCRNSALNYGERSKPMETMAATSARLGMASSSGRDRPNTTSSQQFNIENKRPSTTDNSSNMRARLKANLASLSKQRKTNDMRQSYDSMNLNKQMNKIFCPTGNAR